MQTTQETLVGPAASQSAPLVTPSADLLCVTAFLTDIGLPWRWQPGAAGFIPCVDIVDGTLLLDPGARASGVLHEAGHLATLPGDFRPLAQRNIGGVMTTMFKMIDFGNPESLLARAALQCSDPEATAWAWAAGEHLGMAPDAIIMADEYSNEGDDIRTSLQCRSYVGINGLSHAGFCSLRPGPLAKLKGLPPYPELQFWLQKDFGHEGAAQLRAAQQLKRAGQCECAHVS
jgi:hypothetical protein